MQKHEEIAAATAAGSQEKTGAMAMGSLLADMNHEIRTSINGVRGMLELLLELGMTVCKRLVHMIGGMITIDRAHPPAAELRISIKLPLAADRLCRPAEVETALTSLCLASNSAPPCSGSPDAQKNRVTSAAYSGYTVLVADDNFVNQQVAVRMLEKLGCKAAVAADGMQAIEIHTRKRFDLILMDCEMPVLDGLEATQRIRASEGPEQRTPIIALTACTGQGEQERCLAAGMDDFLSKPIRPQLLGDVLARWLARRSATTTDAGLACEDELEEVKAMFGADFAELASLYQNDGAPRLAAMREAAAAGDCAKVAKVAHAFSGSCASIGATGLAALSKAVETTAKSGSLDNFEQRIAGIENEYRRVCDKLQSLLTP